MKKLMGISLIAVLAVSPMMAMATPSIDGNPVAKDSNTAAADVSTNVSPLYALKGAGQHDDAMASAGYVKGAYNAAIKALNTEYTRATTAESALQTAIDTTNSRIGAIASGDDAGKILIREGEGSDPDQVSSTVAGAIQTLATEIDGLESANNSAVEAINSTIGDLTQSGLVEIRTGSEVTVASGLQQLASEIDGINSATMTLTNKSFNASDATNSLTNVTKSNFASTAIAESVATTGASSDKLVTEAAVRAAVDAVSSTMTDDFATKTGVEATMNAATVAASGTVMVMDNWDADSGTDVTINVNGKLNVSTTGSTAGQSVTTYVPGI